MPGCRHDDAVTVAAGASEQLPNRPARCHTVAVRAPILLAALMLSGAARAGAPAASVTANYTVYAAGLTTARLQAELALSGTGYQIRLGFHTVGLFGAFMRTESNTLAQGVWRGEDPVPFHFAGSGRVQ